MKYILDDVDFCENIGDFDDEYVYDIEIDDETHTFIGNDILIHNSLYITFKPIMDSCYYDGDELEFILNLDKLYLRELFSKYLDEYANNYKVKNVHDFELETINKSGLHIEKKNYLNNTTWEDGIFFEDLSNFIPKGIQIVRSSTPPFVRGTHGEPQREGVWRFIRYIFTNPEQLNVREVLKILKDLKKEYILLGSSDIDSIAMTTSLSNYSKKIIDDQNSLEFVKGAHFSVKAAGFHNYILNKNPEYKTRYDLLRGGKIKWYFCKHEINDRFAYLRGFHPDELTKKEGIEVDWDIMFEKSLLSIVNSFSEPIGLPNISKRLSVLNSIFGHLSSKKVKNDNSIIKEDLEEDFWTW